MLGIQTDEKGLREYLEKEKPFAEIRQIILHHTYRPTTEQYRGLATIQGIWQYHTKTCGWSDIGYHLLVGPEGAIWLGRPIDREGAHAKGQNGDSIGISMIGDFDDEKLGEKQRLATTAALRALLERYELIGECNKLSPRLFAQDLPWQQDKQAGSAAMGGAAIEGKGFLPGERAGWTKGASGRDRARGRRAGRAGKGIAAGDPGGLGQREEEVRPALRRPEKAGAEKT